jgi:threonine dehydrogenase-like Zn-dependent dehydrogenase
MRELNYVGKGKLQWRDTEPPTLRAPEEVLVRPFAVARCDLETAFFRHGLSPLLRLGVASHLLSPRLLEDFGRKPLGGPFPIGHECVAQVIEVGGSVRSLNVGDVVVVPYQISCGHCGLCSRGHTAHCATDRPSPISAFGGFADPKRAWGGMMSDSLRVPFADHLLVPLPSELDPIAYASASDNLVDGYRSVAPGLKNLPGAPVLVVGGRARSIGLYAVTAALALGSEEVVYVDSNTSRLAVAEALGAQVIEGNYKAIPNSKLVHERFPLSVEASGCSAGLHLALSALAVCGTCSIVGLHFRKGTRLPLWDMYARNTNITTGLVDARAVLPEVLNLGKFAKFNPHAVVSTVASWSDAPEALLESSTKVVIERPKLEFSFQT